MKTRIVQWILLIWVGTLCPMVMAQTISEYHGLPLYNSSLYDFDSDGKMEFIDCSDMELKLYNSLTSGFLIYKTLPLNLYLPSGQNYSIQLLNLNNDSHPEIALQTRSSGSFVSAAGYSNLCLLRSDANGEYTQVPETKVPYVVDVNQDGRMDILLSDNQFLMQDIHGNFQLHQYKEVTENDESVFSKWGDDRDFTFNLGSGMGSDAPQVISDAKPVIKTDWGSYGLDYNKDGRMDFIDPLIGKLMINRGGNSYVASRLSSAVYVRDLNGDHILDYVLYDSGTKTISSLIYQPDKGYVRSTLYSNQEMDEKIYFYDTDRDGDVDIVIPFSGTELTKFTYIAVFVNDGKGHFSMEENSFDKNFLFLDCKDIDNDGYFDFVAGVKNLDDQSFEYYLIMGKRGNQFVAEATPFDKNRNNFDPYVNMSGCISDVDNDGIVEVLLSVGRPENYGLNVCKPTVATFNNTPQKMKSPEVLFNERYGTLQISWEEGKDKESSSVDLSYAIRIGSAPGKSDIYYAHARADGSRRNLQPGNMGYNRDVTLNTSYWSSGKYYISVQAIDPLFKGSAWSDEAVFNYDGFYADFTADKLISFSSDTIVVALNTKPDNHLYTYTWNWDGAVMLEENTTDGVYKVYWVDPGIKKIGLEAKREVDGIVKSYQQEIKVYANALENSDRTDADLSFDFNQNGVSDIFRVDGRSGFMKNDGKGGFTSLPGLFNTDVPDISTGLYSKHNYPHVGDYDKDGLPDAMVLFAQSLYTNKGNYKFNRSNIPFTGSTAEHIDQFQVFDMDNDGDYDLLSIYEDWLGTNYTTMTEMYRNKGDNTFEKIPFSLEEEKVNIRSTVLVDLNKDGYVDIIQQGGSAYMQKELSVLMNQGDMTFKVEKMLIPNEYKDKDGYLGYSQFFTYADMNNDGYVDMVRCSDYFAHEITIFYFDGSSFFNNVKSIPFPNGITPQYFGLVDVADVDNNGCMDVIVSLDTYGKGVFYMHQDGSNELKLHNIRSVYGDQFVDLNGDHIPDFIWANNRSAIKNEAPTIPKNIRATQTEKGTVLIEWDAASDKESPQTQLRYNLSVKKKGMSGANSFVISPMNDLKNEAAVVPSYQYISGTRYEVPLYAMPIGDYEIQLQSIDLWNGHSDMSPIYNFTVELQPLIKLPQAACTGKNAEISYVGTLTSALTWDWDGGVVSSTNGNSYSIVWSTPGVKNISVTVDGKVSKASLKVKELTDIVTNMPSVAYVNRKHAFSINGKGWKEQGVTLSFMVRRQGDQEFTDVSSYGMVFSSQVDTLYTIECAQVGNYDIKLAINDGFCLEKSRVIPVEIRSELPLAELEHITVNPTAKNTLSWINKALPAYITSRVIYKETIVAGVYDRLAVIPVSQLTFTDLTSDASVQSYKYKTAYLTNDGAEGECGATHKTIHLMINKSAGNGWNLIWNQYEGIPASTYRIYRGETVDHLSMLTEISGSMNSYTDLSAKGSYYYAIEVVKNTTMRSAVSSTRSNVLSTNSAVNAVCAENIYILGLEASLELSDKQPNLHLYAEIYPMLATYRVVNWQIVSGNQYAEINQNGLLIAKPSVAGTVVVRATALDGSGIFAELTVNKQHTTGIDEVRSNETCDLQMYPSPAITDFTISGIPTGNSEAIVSIYGINGAMIHQEKTKESSVTINCSSFAKGFHLVRVQTQAHIFMKKIMVK